MPNIENSKSIARDFIKKWEQLASKSVSKTSYYSHPDSISGDSVVYAYPDAAKYSIGWGSYESLSDGTPVVRGLSITKNRADSELEYEISKKERVIRDMITVELSDSQYAALIDLAYNAGEGSLKFNGLLDAINSGEDLETITSIWRGVATTSMGKTLTVLKNRRIDESKLFNDSYNEVYSYYLRNESTVNYAVIGGVLIAMTGYLYFLKTRKII